MLTKECVSCREFLPIERFPPLPRGGRCDQCDAPYCQALRHAALTAVHMAMIRTYWPLPLMAVVIIALSIILSPLLWWSFVPLTVWAAWKLRTIQDQSTEMFSELPAGVIDRVDRLGYLRDLRAELLRANITITPGIERYLSGSWKYRDLSPSDRLAIDAANVALTERVTTARYRQE